MFLSVSSLKIQILMISPAITVWTLRFFQCPVVIFPAWSRPILAQGLQAWQIRLDGSLFSCCQSALRLSSPVDRITPRSACLHELLIGVVAERQPWPSCWHMHTHTSVNTHTLFTLALHSCSWQKLFCQCYMEEVHIAQVASKWHLPQQPANNTSTTFPE